MHLALPAGDTLKVYRLKHWTFDNGDPPALQLEYEAPFSVADTAAVYREARTIWPFFAPYVEAQSLTDAIITATNFRMSGVWPLAWTSRSQYFGVVAAKSADGQWRFQSDSVPLPAADTSGTPRIMEPNGRPLSFDIVYPKAGLK